MEKLIKSLSLEELITIDTIKYPFVSSKYKIIKNNTKSAVKIIEKINKSDDNKSIYIEKCTNYLMKKYPQYVNYNIVDYKYFEQMKNVFNEMLKKKFCKNCMILGNHYQKSRKCPINIKTNNYITGKIIEYCITKDISNDNEDIFNKLAEILNETVPMIKNLYWKIDPIKLLERPFNLDDFVKGIESINCDECAKKIYKASLNSVKLWNNKEICDTCWACQDKRIIRENLWEKIVNYKKLQCHVCKKYKKNQGERFHLDHISMFDKTNSVCCMVNTGTKIEIIKSEIDKCEVVCKSCHDLITKLEGKYPFKRVKSNLTRKFNLEEITEEEYETQKREWDEIYRAKMSEIYNDLSKIVM